MKIAIIGSGISGLYLGLILKSKNYDFDIYEKNNSIGGRIEVVEFDNIPVVAGAGRSACRHSGATTLIVK